ncbi:putative phosphomannomutase 1 [Sesbania bispinosa]|nr:putative phosphomannomutase 1 [Sesbania bispinosa]
MKKTSHACLPLPPSPSSTHAPPLHSLLANSSSSCSPVSSLAPPVSSLQSSGFHRLVQAHPCLNRNPRSVCALWDHGTTTGRNDGVSDRHEVMVGLSALRRKKRVVTVVTRSKIATNLKRFWDTHLEKSRLLVCQHLGTRSRRTLCNHLRESKLQ